MDRALLVGWRLDLEAPVLVEGDAGVLLPARRPQHVQLDHRRFPWVDLERQLHCTALYAVQHHLLVGGELGGPDVPVVVPQGLDAARGLDPHVVVALEGETPGQRHDLVPALAGEPRVHVEQDYDPALSVGRCGGGVDARWVGRSEIEEAVGRDDQLVALVVVVAQQVLAAAHVAVEDENVPVADGPEVRTCAVVAHQREHIVLGEGMQVLPGLQVLRSEDEVGRDPLAAGPVGQGAAREGVVDAVLLPDAGVEHRVLARRAVVVRDGDDRLAGDLLPVEQEGVAGDGDHVADLRPVVDRYHPVVLGEGTAGEAALLRVGVYCIGQVAPVDQVVADRVPPVRAGVFRRVALVEEVPAALPEAEPVGVVQGVLGAYEVVQRAVGVALHRPSGRGHALDHRVLAKLGLLLVEAVREAVPGSEGRAVRAGHGVSCRAAVQMACWANSYSQWGASVKSRAPPRSPNSVIPARAGVQSPRPRSQL